MAVGHWRTGCAAETVRAGLAGDRPLSSGESAELQQHLARFGLYEGAIDGELGPRSRAAIRAFQSGAASSPTALRACVSWRRCAAAELTWRHEIKPRRHRRLPLPRRAPCRRRPSARRPRAIVGRWIVVAQNEERGGIFRFLTRPSGGARNRRKWPRDSSNNRPAAAPPRGVAAAARTAATAEREAPRAAEVAKADDASRVLVVGDFMASALSKGLVEAYAEKSAVLVVDASNGSSGLVRDDYYDWTANCRRSLKRRSRRSSWCWSAPMIARRSRARAIRSATPGGQPMRSASEPSRKR